MVEPGFGASGPGRAPGLDPDEFHEKTQKSDDAKSGARRQHDQGKPSTVRLGTRPQKHYVALFGKKSEWVEDVGRERVLRHNSRKTLHVTDFHKVC